MFNLFGAGFRNGLLLSCVLRALNLNIFYLNFFRPGLIPGSAMNLFFFIGRHRAVCCGMVLLLICTPSLLRAAECDEVVATAVSLQGVVESRSKSRADWEAVTTEDTFCAGDMVRTQANSRAALYLNNNSILRLSEFSTVTFSGLSGQGRSWLDLKHGIAHFISRIKQNFEVVTPYVNAAVEGTEFVVAIDTEQAEVTVLEGQVQARNDQGEVSLSHGEAAVVRAGEAPMLRVQVRPWDAVSWALYYPAIIDFTAQPRVELPEPWGARLAQSVESSRQGDISAALEELESLPEDLTNGQIYVYRAALGLAIGQAARASVDLEYALKLDATNGEAIALKAIIAIVRNETDLALRLAQEAVSASPDELAPLLAKSYAQQAVFDLEQARLTTERAVKSAPESALAWARLAELHLMFGELDHALQAARRAAEIAPDLARAQSGLGFAYLTRIDIDAAEQAFNHAITLDQADPLPRLGLGLAMIRRGELEAGRRQIEYAASLDPTNPLIRSYLGKAYYEEKRNLLAAEQLTMARELDPKDPTPWFYDAIRKQSENRPVEALQDLQQSIKLNDNRAVYRSRLLLDEDAAARSASQARIYNDLGFRQLALVEGWNSLNTDPTNYSAHRFLADSYAHLPRHEIGRLAELLQTQLWQPLQLNSLQPQLGESGLGILEGAGPSDSAFNEFTPLFMRDRISLQANGIVAGNETWGDDLVLSGIQGPLSFSLGQFHYESEGFRENNDQQQDIYNIFMQYSVSPRTSLQAEYRILELERGDLALRFDPDNFSPNLRERRDVETLRLGMRHAFSRGSQTIGSLIMQNFNETSEDIPVPILSIDTLREDAPYLAELQQVIIADRYHLITGLGHFRSDRETTITQVLDVGFPVPPSSTTDIAEEKVEHTNAYLYSQYFSPHGLTWLLGASADIYQGSIVEHKQLNPKFGLTWSPTDTLSLRMAAFRTLKRELITDQTVEPTQIAGFNQFFDDNSGTDSKRYGLALDKKLLHNAFGGIELSYRDLDVPFKDSNGDTQESSWKESLNRAYLYWHVNRGLAMRIEYQYEVIDSDVENVRDDVLLLKTRRLPLGVSYYLPLGLSLTGNATFVDQEGRFYDSVNLATAEGGDRFWIIDAKLDYRLPKRRGIISLGAKNLLNSSFSYHELDPQHPTIYPERLIFTRFTAVF